MALRSIPPARVLCVDDNAEVGEAIVALLKGSSRFCCLGCLANAAELLRFGPALRPDLVLLDLEMPGPDALESLPKFLDLWPDVRVVVLSGQSGQEIVEKAMDCGAWGFICKADGLEEIVRCLGQVAGGTFAFSETVADQFLINPVSRPAAPRRFLA